MTERHTQQRSMSYIRLQAVDLVLHALKYKRRGKERTCYSASRVIDYCMRKQYRQGWNSCAAFCLSFPDGERLEASIKGGLKVVL